MEFTQAVAGRHMTRNFSGRVPDDGLVDGLLADALRAPSAGNTQGRAFVVLEGPAQTRRYWMSVTDEEWRSRSTRYPGLSRAPVIVLPFADEAAYVARYDEADKRQPGEEPVDWVVPYWMVDTAFATMTVLLGASDRGLGAAFLGNFRGEEPLRRALGVPEGLRWLGAVLLGEAAQPEPTSSSAARPRSTLADSVHRGRW